MSDEFCGSAGKFIFLVSNLVLILSISSIIMPKLFEEILMYYLVIEISLIHRGGGEPVQYVLGILAPHTGVIEVMVITFSPSICLKQQDYSDLM